MADRLTTLLQFPHLGAALANSPELLAEVNQLKTDPGRIPGANTVPNCAHVRLIFALANGKTASIRVSGSYSPPFTPTVVMANSVQTAMVTAWTSSGIGALMHNGTSFVGVGIRDINAPKLPEFVSTNAAVVGTGGTTALPPQTALVVTLRTGTSGQGGRGRIYVPGWSSAADTGNGIASGAATAADQAFIQQLSTAMNAGGVNLALCLGLVQRAAYTGKTGTPHAARNAQTLPVTAIVVENAVWDTQRRRSYPV